MQSKNLKNIIVVDDDRSIRVVISTALTRAGYNVKSSGTAAGMRRLVESDFADILITYKMFLIKRVFCFCHAGFLVYIVLVAD